MHDNFDTEPEVLKAKITGETARIHWHELQKFYAAGAVIEVAAGLDLVAVAYAFAIDDKNQVAGWLQEGQLQRVEDTRASHWYQHNAQLWAVVVSPWVLVQDPHIH
jgi:hypothetical protein